MASFDFTKIGIQYMKKTAEDFSLRGTMRQLNKGDKRSAVLADAVFLWIYLAGIWGWMISAFQITAAMPLLFLGLMPIAVLLSILTADKRKGNMIGVIAFFLILMLGAVIFHKGILSGFNLMLNQAMDALGKEFPYMWPVYRVTVSEKMYPLTVSMTILWSCGFLGSLGLYLMRSGNRLLLGLHAAAAFLVQIFFQIAPDLFWNGAVVLAILAVWFRGHGEKLPPGRQRLASIGNFILTAVSVFVIFLILQIFLPVNTYQKNDTVKNWKENIYHKLEDIRYNGSSQVLPEGDFENLGSFTPGETPVLEITMSVPESYYLRGFTGSVYTGTGWEAKSDEDRWEYRSLFYWLHDSGYYGQETLSQAAEALGDEELEEANLITIENIAGSSRYCYVPYEVCDADSENLLPFAYQKIGDENLIAEGFRGSRSYTYTAWSNQVVNYASFAAKLLESEKLDEAGKEYQKLEGYYNQFVYENYLDIPGNLRTQIKKLVGEANRSQDDKHTDYAEAKQNILYILNAECTYQEELEEAWNGSDFINDFLNRTKAGYSIHYASAAVMLFRYYGIPARYVEGYLVTPEDVKQMTAGEPYTLDETHAHAWVEYYQDGVGWLPFETTPSYLNVMPKAEDYQDISGAASGTGTKQETEEDLEEEETQEEEEFDWLLIIEILLLAGIAVLFLLLLSFLIYVIIQRRKSKKAKLLFYSADKREAVRSIFSYMMNILAVAGLEIRNTSLYRYGAPIEKMFDKEIRDKYEEAASIRQEAVYSNHEITEEQRIKVMELKDLIWHRVYNGSNWVQKFQLKYIYFL